MEDGWCFCVSFRYGGAPPFLTIVICSKYLHITDMRFSINVRMFCFFQLSRTYKASLSIFKLPLFLVSGCETFQTLNDFECSLLLFCASAQPASAICCGQKYFYNVFWLFLYPRIYPTLFLSRYCYRLTCPSLLPIMYTLFHSKVKSYQQFALRD